ncbi:MAG TPA: FkbM family methyltransferase [Longimicrobiales bacterium]
MKSPTHYLAAVRAQKHPARFITARFLAKTGLSPLFRIRGEGFTLKFFPTAMSSLLWVDPEDRQEDTHFYRAYLREGDVVVDAGANIGHLALLAATLIGKSGRVDAIEAHPLIARYLQKNVDLNNASHVHVHVTAVGSTPGAITFTDAASDDQNAVSTEGRGVTVPVTTLDSLLDSALTRVDLLKIDVEGYELHALRGATALLQRTACVYFESWDHHCARYGTTAGDVIGLLEDSGFTVFNMDDEVLVRIDRGHRSEKCENLVAVRSVDQLSSRLTGPETRWRVTR